MSPTAVRCPVEPTFPAATMWPKDWVDQMEQKDSMDRKDLLDHHPTDLSGEPDSRSYTLAHFQGGVAPSVPDRRSSPLPKASRSPIRINAPRPTFETP